MVNTLGDSSALPEEDKSLDTINNINLRKLGKYSTMLACILIVVFGSQQMVPKGLFAKIVVAASKLEEKQKKKFDITPEIRVVDGKPIVISGTVQLTPGGPVDMQYSRMFNSAEALDQDDYRLLVDLVDQEIKKEQAGAFVKASVGSEADPAEYQTKFTGKKITNIEITGISSPEAFKHGPGAVEPGQVDQENIDLAKLRAEQAVEDLEKNGALGHLKNAGYEVNKDLIKKAAENLDAKEIQFSGGEIATIESVAHKHGINTGDVFKDVGLLVEKINTKQVKDGPDIQEVKDILNAKRGVIVKISYEAQGEASRVVKVPIPMIPIKNVEIAASVGSTTGISIVIPGYQDPAAIWRNEETPEIVDEEGKPIPGEKPKPELEPETEPGPGSDTPAPENTPSPVDQGPTSEPIPPTEDEPGPSSKEPPIADLPESPPSESTPDSVPEPTSESKPPETPSEPSPVSKPEPTLQTTSPETVPPSSETGPNVEPVPPTEEEPTPPSGVGPESIPAPVPETIPVSGPESQPTPLSETGPKSVESPDKEIIMNIRLKLRGLKLKVLEIHKIEKERREWMDRETLVNDLGKYFDKPETANRGLDYAVIIEDVREKYDDFEDDDDRTAYMTDILLETWVKHDKACRMEAGMSDLVSGLNYREQEVQVEWAVVHADHLLDILKKAKLESSEQSTLEERREAYQRVLQSKINQLSN